MARNEHCLFLPNVFFFFLIRIVISFHFSRIYKLSPTFSIYLKCIPRTLSIRDSPKFVV